jgi:hypothetical protein
MHSTPKKKKKIAERTWWPSSMYPLAGSVVLSRSRRFSNISRTYLCKKKKKKKNHLEKNVDIVDT